MAIDANAMYRAGFGSKSTGKNVRVDEQNARLDAITKTAFNVLGQAAIGQIKQNYKGLQQYRNASDSQTALLNLKVDKMPASSAEYAIEESQSLKGSVVELKSLYDAAARKASFGIGKGRSQGRQDMTRYMKQLIDMNAILEIHKTKREKAQSMTSVAAGGERQEGAKNMSAGSDVVKVGNSTDLALGGIGARLRWNIETGEMEVQVGGDWRTDKQTGLRTYKDKAETGTYEEYVAQDQEMHSELDQRYEKYYNEESGTGVSDQNIQSRKEWNKSQGLEEGFDTRLLREEWTKQKQEERGAVSTILYKNMKFAVEADGKMAETVRGINGDIFKMSYKKDAVKWKRVSEKYYGELQAKIGEYTDDEFKDYFFGGDTFDHSTGRMTESAPAYQLLYEEDEKYGLVKDGKWKDSEKHGPGTEDWEGRLLLLKGQSFVKGSFYRKEATDRIFKNLENKYIGNVAAYKIDNPVQEPNDPNSGKYTTFLGNTVEIPTTEAGKKDKALIENIALDSPTVTVNGVEYERVNGAGYDYRAIKDKGGKITSGGDEVTKEYLIRSVSPIYGNINDGYFGTSTYKMPKVKFDPSGKQVTIQQMKDTLPKGTNLNKSDEEIRKAYKKYVLSLRVDKTPKIEKNFIRN